MKKMVMGILIGISFTASSAFAAGDIAAGKAKSAVCAACHGADGIAIPGYPNPKGNHSALFPHAYR